MTINLNVLSAWTDNPRTSTDSCIGIKTMLTPDATLISQPIENITQESGMGNQPRFLHVVEQGAVLHRRGSRIIVTKNKKLLLDVSAMKLQGVLLYGNIQISTQCMRNLLEEGVWMSFLSRNGFYKGRLQPPTERGGKLRQMQWQRSRDPEFCLGFARAVVRGKIWGQRRLAAAYAKNYLAETLSDNHHRLGESLNRIDKTGDLEELRGVEGSATRAYFERFRHWNRSTLPFEHRDKRGATDPINVLLNFGYTLVLRELDGLIEAAGLDPAIGFYHLPDNDRPSLACDWMEEFRHPLVDRLVLKLVNKGVMKVEDFDNLEERGGLRLKPDGLRKFLNAYEKMMTGTRVGTKSPCGWRNVFLRQLALLLDAIVGKRSYCAHTDAEENVDAERKLCCM